MFIVTVLVLLCFGGSLAINCLSMNNQPCIVRSMRTDMNPDKFHYYPVIISMNRCNGNCSTVKDPFGRMCIPNKIEDMNLKVFNIIKGINASETLGKHI